AGLPEFGTVSAQAVDADESDALWITVTDFLTPTTLMLGDAGEGAAAPEVLKTMPAFFDASRHVVEQHFATSKDGTRVPYFLVRPKDLAYDGSNPTLLYGYGGFEISLTPGYSGGARGAGARAGAGGGGGGGARRGRGAGGGAARHRGRGRGRPPPAAPAARAGPAPPAPRPAAPPRPPAPAPPPPRPPQSRRMH